MAKFELDVYHTSILEQALIEYAKHVTVYEKKQAATDILSIVAYAKAKGN